MGTTLENQVTPGPRLSWSVLSISLAVIALGALTALVIVAGTARADTLSTIALALAVITFAAQLIVSMIQSATGAQQLAETERVNVSTQSALAALRAASDALLTMQRDQFGQVLKVALSRVVPAAVSEAFGESGDQVGVDEVERGQLERTIVSRVLEEVGRSPASPMNMDTVTPVPRPEYQRIVTYPSEARGRELARILNTLTPWEAQAFAKLATSVRNRARRGSELGMPTIGDADDPGPATKGLAAKGLTSLEKRPLDGEVRTWMTLTPLGMEVASLILGMGPVPAWLTDEIVKQ